ncbi:DUF4142 domain-containing protein [Dyadobacter arcticus]|uniref:Membrane protein n=1 Tax=Dyadobacter arcticus TaxID=1078754 RepID=A0ABX0UGX8_9BACT|nr:DUF4142 domain-containing protein [Dyadobacter arcticus]NIJ52261.1 putative membrane protein [Dyadobacter arcticus]
MKAGILCIFLAVYGLNLGCSGTKPNASEKKTAEENEAKASRGLLDEKVAAFLVDAADARMMGIKEGTLAVANGTTPEIRAYGKLMEKDQGKMMDAIKKLAKSRHVTLPQTISADKQDGFQDLAKKEGKDFDSKFIKMMRIDHERDLKKFKEATTLNDKSVKQFGDAYIPMIQGHLDQVNALKE